MPERFSTPTNSPNVNFNLTTNGIRGFTDDNADNADNAAEAFSTPTNSPNVNFGLSRDGIRGFPARS